MSTLENIISQTQLGHLPALEDLGVLIEAADDAELMQELMSSAAALRDSEFNNVVTFSSKSREMMKVKCSTE